MKYFNKDASKVWLTNDEVKTAQSSKLYYTLCVILYLLQTVDPKTEFRQYFEDLLSKYPCWIYGIPCRLGAPPAMAKCKIVLVFKEKPYCCITN